MRIITFHRTGIEASWTFSMAELAYIYMDIMPKSVYRMTHRD